jgi:hypothetical protein
MTQPNLLRAGLLLDSFDAPAWVYDAIQRLRQAAACEICVVVLNQNPPRAASGSLVYEAYRQLDEKIFHRQPNAFDIQSLKPLLEDAPVMPVQPVREPGGEALAHQDIARLRDLKLDVLVKFGFGALTGPVLECTTHGVWAYQFGDDQENRGTPAGYWEVVEGQPETGASLRVLGEQGQAERVLFAGRFSTYPLSPVDNRNYAAWAASPFLARQAAALHRLGPQAFFESTRRFNPEIRAYDRPYRRLPGSGTALRHALGMGGRLAKEAYHRLFSLDTWYLAYQFGSQDYLSLEQFRVLMPPKDRFWADPMIVQKDGRYFIFVEELPFATGRGHLSVIEMDAHGNVKEPVRVLEKPYHLSYPFVFEWRGSYYMVPETAENGTVDLYQCVEFPHRWEFCRSLLTGVKAVDSTLLFQEGKWWLFTGQAENPNALPQVELYLYSADSLFAETWTPHPLNPLLSDDRLARPGGRIFSRDGKIYRPAQDCSKTYGYGLRLNEITRLTESDYEEKQVSFIEPLWKPGIIGTHTFATAGDLTVIDVHTLRSKYW